VCDAGLAPQRAQVEQLAGAARAEAHEPLEGGEVLDVDDLPHVALQIGRHVRGHPVARRDAMGVDGGIPADKDQLVEPWKGLGSGGKLADREWQSTRSASTVPCSQEKRSGQRWESSKTAPWAKRARTPLNLRARRRLRQGRRD